MAQTRMYHQQHLHHNNKKIIFIRKTLLFSLILFGFIWFIRQTLLIPCTVFTSRYGAPLSPVLSTGPSAYDYGTGWVIILPIPCAWKAHCLYGVRYGAPLAPVVSYEPQASTTAAPTLAPSTQTLAPSTQTQTTYAETTFDVVPVPEPEVGAWLNNLPLIVWA